jgi:hypothetical protein
MPRGSAPGERRGGRAAGVPNKLNRSIKEMIVGALSAAGGENYLLRQAEQNPVAFMSLVGRVLPLQVTGDAPTAIQFVIRAPPAISSTAEWLRLYAPNGGAAIEAEAEAEDAAPDDAPSPPPVEPVAQPSVSPSTAAWLATHKPKRDDYDR